MPHRTGVSRKYGTEVLFTLLTDWKYAGYLPSGRERPGSAWALGRPSLRSALGDTSQSEGAVNEQQEAPPNCFGHFRRYPGGGSRAGNRKFPAGFELLP